MRFLTANTHYHESPIMIRITDPQGPDAARSMVHGMLAVAELKNLAPDVVLSANCSMVIFMAGQMPNSREVILTTLRSMIQTIESGDFPTGDHAFVRQPAPGEKLH